MRIGVAVGSTSLRRRLEAVLTDAGWDVVGRTDVADPRACGDIVVAEPNCIAPGLLAGDEVHIIALVTGVPDPFWTSPDRRLVAGVVDRDDPEHELVLAVRAVTDGRGWVSPEFARAVLSSTSAAPSTAYASSSGPRPTAVHRAVPGEPALAGLTAREYEVSLAIAHGLSNAQIASELRIEVSTVKYHVSNVLSKSGCLNRAQLIAFLHGRAPLSLGKPTFAVLGAAATSP